MLRSNCQSCVREHQISVLTSSMKESHTSIHKQLPLAQSEFAQTSQQLNLAKAKGALKQNALEQERFTIRDLKIRLAEFEAKSALVSKTVQELSISQSEVPYVTATHASAQARAAEYLRKSEFSQERIKDHEGRIEDLQSESRMLALERNTAEMQISCLKGDGGACATAPAPLVTSAEPAVQADLDRQNLEIQRLSKAISDWSDPNSFLTHDSKDGASSATLATAEDPDDMSGLHETSTGMNKSRVNMMKKDILVRHIIIIILLYIFDLFLRLCQLPLRLRFLQVFEHHQASNRDRILAADRAILLVSVLTSCGNRRNYSESLPRRTDRFPAPALVTDNLPQPQKGGGGDKIECY